MRAAGIWRGVVSVQISGLAEPFGQTLGSYGGRLGPALIPGWLGPSQETQRLRFAALVVVEPPSAGVWVAAASGTVGPALKWPQAPSSNSKRMKCSRWPIWSNWLTASAW